MVGRRRNLDLGGAHRVTKPPREDGLTETEASHRLPDSPRSLLDTCPMLHGQARENQASSLLRGQRERQVGREADRRWKEPTRDEERAGFWASQASEAAATVASGRPGPGQEEMSSVTKCRVLLD